MSNIKNAASKVVQNRLYLGNAFAEEPMLLRLLFRNSRYYIFYLLSSRELRQRECTVLWVWSQTQCIIGTHNEDFMGNAAFKADFSLHKRCQGGREGGDFPWVYLKLYINSVSASICYYNWDTVLPLAHIDRVIPNYADNVERRSSEYRALVLSTKIS